MKSKYCSKLSQKDVMKMKRLTEEGLAIQYIARLFGCRPNAVYYRVYDTMPPRVFTETEKLKSLRMSKLSVAKVKRIRKLAVEKGIDAVSLAKKFNVSQTAILGIVNGRTFRWIEGETKKGYLKPIEYKNIVTSDKRRGHKIGGKRRVKHGVLLKYAKKYGIHTSTACRWIKKGRIKVKTSEKA